MRIIVAVTAGLAFAFLLIQTGCSLLVGNVKPVEEKSENYGVLDLSKTDPDWLQIDSAKNSEISSSEISDVAFQSKKTASIISLNSACRPSYQTSNKSLQSFSDDLFWGITNITLKNQRKIQLQQTPALETTIQGQLNGEPMKLRSIVLHRGSCIYDLTYVARPHHFEEQEADFSRFVASLKLK